MARFLSDEWFADVERRNGPASGDRGADLVVEQIVTGGPDGDVRYQVTTGPRGTAVQRGAADRPHLVFTTDYPTAAAIAEGKVSAATAVAEGRVRVKGSVRRMAASASALAGADLLPVDVRARTTY